MHIFSEIGCGMKLRSDDPTSMKDFILSVRSRVNELKGSPEDVEAKAHEGKRVRLSKALFNIS